MKGVQGDDIKTTWTTLKDILSINGARCKIQVTEMKENSEFFNFFLYRVCKPYKA